MFPYTIYHFFGTVNFLVISFITFGSVECVIEYVVFGQVDGNLCHDVGATSLGVCVRLVVLLPVGQIDPSSASPRLTTLA